MNQKEIIKRVTRWLKDHMEDYADIEITIEIEKAELTEIANKESLDMSVKITD